MGKMICNVLKSLQFMSFGRQYSGFCHSLERLHLHLSIGPKNKANQSTKKLDRTTRDECLGVENSYKVKQQQPCPLSSFAKLTREKFLSFSTTTHMKSN